MNIPEFFNLCKAHDWYYQMSDDGRVFKAGEAAERRLKSLAQESPEHQDIFNRWQWHMDARVGGKPTTEPTLATQTPKEDNTMKFPIGTPVLLDDRPAKISGYDEKTLEYLVRPDAPLPGQTKVRPSRRKQDEIVLLEGAQPTGQGIPGTKAVPRLCRLTFTQGDPKTVEVKAFFGEDGWLDVDGHPDQRIGPDGMQFNPGDDFEKVEWLEMPAAPAPVAEVPKPAPVVETPKPKAEVAKKAEVALVPELAGFQFISGEAVDGPGFMDTPRLQFGQGIGKSIELGWSMGSIYFADLEVAPAIKADPKSPSPVGAKAGPLKLVFLLGDAYWIEDIPFDEAKEKGLTARQVRTRAELAKLTSDYGWKSCVDYTFLVQKPAAFNDTLGLFTLNFGGHDWAMAVFTAREGSGTASVISVINTDARLYLKGRPYVGLYELSTEVVKGKMNIFAVAQFKRRGVWDDATQAGIVEILKGFAKG